MFKAFLVSLFYIFIAEMGDKTQLVALAFATRFSAKIVLSAVFVATLLVHLFSVAIGAAASAALPVFWIRLASAIAFLGFGIWTLRGDELNEEEKKAERQFGPFLTVAITFFIAELGDKTMLATITVASQQASWMGVWLGSTVGMVLADGLAVIAGRTLGMNLPEKPIQYGAAAIFIGSGLYLLAELFLKR